jgi:hypothetical protein
MEIITNNGFSDGRASIIGLTAATDKLLAHCQANNWAGYDPYDALNSRIFTALPFLNTRVIRLAFTQALKRSPVNLRRLALIPKTQNPKAIALFLTALLNLERASGIRQDSLVKLMIEKLIALRSPGHSNWCWGYSFAWQTRKVLVPRGTPNLVCTTFVANALLDAYEQREEAQCLSMAASAAEYILKDLYWDDGALASFSYPLPSIRKQIHNANFLAAALLCRIYKHTGEKKYLVPALKVARCSAEEQHADGSWFYGEMPSDQWIDNFHTGYNLCALKSISAYAGTDEFDSFVRRGFEYYRTHFFREDGAVRYFHDRTYPIDIHCVAQSIITLLEFQDLDPGNLPLAYSVFQWAMDHMWDDRGFFYYRILRSCTIRTSYMRWSQAWMLLSMSTLLREGAGTMRRTQAEQTAIPA